MSLEVVCFEVAFGEERRIFWNPQKLDLSSSSHGSDDWADYVCYKTINSGVYLPFFGKYLGPIVRILKPRGLCGQKRQPKRQDKNNHKAEHQTKAISQHAMLNP